LPVSEDSASCPVLAAVLAAVLVLLVPAVLPVLVLGEAVMEPLMVLAFLSQAVMSMPALRQAP
jgi:hypothetical protein